MMHKMRVHSVGTVDTARHLAEKLTGTTWCLCTGFSLEGHPDYLWLNDATSEDGAAEFGIVRRTADGFLQVESVTYSWMTNGEALKSIEAALAGEFDAQGWAVTIRLDEAPKHRCHLCA